MRAFTGLRAALVGTFLLGMVAVVGIASITQAILLQRNLRNEIHAEVAAATLRLSANLSSPLWNLDSSTVAALLENESASRWIDTVILVTTEGERTGFHGGKTVAPTDQPPAEYVGRETQPVVYPIPDGRLLGEIRVYGSLSHLQNQVRAELLRQFFIILSASMVLAGVLYAATLGIVRRVHTMRDTARAIENHEFDRRFPSSGTDELSDLGTSLNSLTTTLANQLSTLKAEVERRKKIESELDQARQAAEEASAAKSRFVAHISHEIRNPLSVLLGFLRLIDAESMDAENRDLVDGATRGGEALAALLDDVLDYSRIEAGAMELEETVFDLFKLMENVRALYAPVAKQKEVAFAVTLDPSLPRYAEGDPLRLRQIVLNLLSNAFKFTTSGFVSVEARSETGMPRVGELWTLCVQVRDSGIGMTPETQAAVFDSFRQASSSTARQYGGSGLGLAIVHSLVQLYSGEISVTSEAGVGTTFSVRLPLICRLAEAGNPQEEAVQTAGRLRLLAVDDDLLVRRVLERMLGALGHRCRLAASGAEAITAVEEEAFDAIFLDLSLGEVDGFEVARKMHQHRPKLRIIALTGDWRPTMAEEAAAHGISSVLAKPVEIEDIRQALAPVEQS